jgi:hypothetical protein
MSNRRGTQLVHGILQVLEKKGWLPGVGSNHDKNNQCRLCKLQSSQWSKMPDWTRKTNTRTGGITRRLHPDGTFRLRVPARLYRPEKNGPIGAARSWLLAVCICAFNIIWVHGWAIGRRVHFASRMSSSRSRLSKPNCNGTLTILRVAV